MKKKMSRPTGPFLIGAIGISGAVAVALLTTGHRVDFGLDWIVTTAFISGIDPYQPIDQLAQQVGSSVPPSFSFYPPRTPAVLLIQAPIGWVPIDHGYLVGRLLTVGSFVFLAWVISRLGRIPLHWCLAAMPLLLLVWPFSTVLAFSQTGFLVAGLIGVSWFMASREDRYLAGVPLAAAIAFKMWPWMVVPALWLSGFRKTAGGAFLAFGALNLAGLLFPQISLASALTALFSAQNLDTWSLAGSIGLPAWAGAVIGIAAIYVLSRFFSSDVTVMSSIGVGLLLAPVLWPHYLVALLVPVAHAQGRHRQRLALGRSGLGDGPGIGMPGTPG